jgi:hypothetical protein
MPAEAPYADMRVVYIFIFSSESPYLVHVSGNSGCVKEKGGRREGEGRDEPGFLVPFVF